MRKIDRRSIAGVAIVTMVVGLGSAGALGQGAGTVKAPSTSVAPAKQWKHPRTPWGDPDLQGIWSDGHFANVPLERRPEHAGKYELTQEEADARYNKARDNAAGLEGQVGTYGRELSDTDTLGEIGIHYTRRTSLITDPPDGRLPPLTPAGQERQAAEKKQQADLLSRPVRWVDDLIWGGGRCLTDVYPARMEQVLGHDEQQQIVQGPGYVSIHYELYNEMRMIPIGDRPTSSIPQWWGQPHGHWEGNTLVVETKHYNGRMTYHSSGENLRLIERFTRVSDRVMDYQYTVDDPTTFTRPWTVKIDFFLDPRQVELSEFSCHEGNYAIPTIIRGAQAEAEKAAAAKKPPR